MINRKSNNSRLIYLAMTFYCFSQIASPALAVNKYDQLKIRVIAKRYLQDRRYAQVIDKRGIEHKVEMLRPYLGKDWEFELLDNNSNNFLDKGDLLFFKRRTNSGKKITGFAYDPISGKIFEITGGRRLTPVQRRAQADKVLTEMAKKTNL